MAVGVPTDAFIREFIRLRTNELWDVRVRVTITVLMAKHGGSNRCDECARPTPCPTVRIIAGLFCEHPDYLQEWAE